MLAFYLPCAAFNENFQDCKLLVYSKKKKKKKSTNLCIICIYANVCATYLCIYEKVYAFLDYTFYNCAVPLVLSLWIDYGLFLFTET